MKSYMKAVRKVVKENLNYSNVFIYGDKKYVSYGVFGIALWDENLLPRTLRLDIEPPNENLIYTFNEIMKDKPSLECNMSPVVVKQHYRNTRVMIIGDMVYYCNDKFISMFEEYGDVCCKARFDERHNYPIIYVYDCRDLFLGIIMPLIIEHEVLLDFLDDIDPINRKSLWPKRGIA